MEEKSKESEPIVEEKADDLWHRFHNALAPIQGFLDLLALAPDYPSHNNFRRHLGYARDKCCEISRIAAQLSRLGNPAVNLPPLPEPAPGISPLMNGREDPKNARFALLVHHDPIACSAISAYLGDNYTVATAGDIRSLPDKTDQCRFDVVILDQATLLKNRSSPALFREKFPDPALVLLIDKGEHPQFEEKVDIILRKPMSLADLHNGLAKIGRG